MKLPLSWLKKFVDLDAPAREIADRLSAAGLVVENIETIAPAFQGVVVAKVIEAGRHPNADRLSLCQVDAGSKGRFSVVCGAPNVRSGMTVALALVGARLAGAGKEQGEGVARDAPPLEAATIRGVRSEGMLCSERELKLSTEHAGILALPDNAPIGADLADFLLLPDTVLDVEITPNRGDCLSIIGLAREVAAIFGVALKIPRPRAVKPKSKVGAVFGIDIAAPELCPRYAALAMTEIKIGPSPIRIRRRLELCGMRALNNVVDATNYVMLEMGQPLHAFDLAKISAGKIIVRRAGSDREFTTLDNLKRELQPDDLLIADPAGPLAIAGVMGGLSSEVSDSTTAILLESAFFEPSTIARTSRRLQLHSEASYRFARGIDRAGQAVALARVAELVGEFAGGKAAGEIADIDARPAPRREIIIDLADIETLTGASIPPAETKRRLKAIGTEVKPAGRGALKVVPPPWRPDLNEPADLVEEVARLSGLDDVPSAMPARVVAQTAVNPQRVFLRNTREVMLGAGLDEARTLAFTAPADNARFPGVVPSAQSVKVQNPLSAELSELRLSLMPGLVASLQFNLNRQAAAFHAFEIGKIFLMEAAVATERLVLAALSHGAYLIPAIGEAGIAAGFFSMKGILESWFDAMDLRDRISFNAIEPSRAPFLHPARAAEIVFDGVQTGYLGELHPQEAMRLELGAPCAVCELDLAKLISYGFSPPKTIEAPPRFPAIRRDVALVVDRDLPAAMVVRTVKEVASAMLESVEVFDVYEGQGIAPGRKSVALACRYRAKDRTLTDEEVNRVHSAVVEQTRTRLGAELRQ
ncbi:MAG: phenylalanine--tRNA ligase subunit beta [Candidatus Binataceae bacterium]